MELAPERWIDLCEGRRAFLVEGGQEQSTEIRNQQVES